jgi:hypothetical protein
VDLFRNIRSVLPSFMLFGNLLMGAWFEGLVSLATLKELPAHVLAAIIAILAAATLPVGFVIGGVSILILRLFIDPFLKDRYEGYLSDEAWARIWERCEFRPSRNDRDNRLWGLATFVRVKLSDNVHEFLERRWHATNMHANAAVAVVLAHAIGWTLLKPVHFWTWFIWSYVLFALFLALAIVTWRDLKSATEFLTHPFDDATAGNDGA